MKTIAIEEIKKLIKGYIRNINKRVKKEKDTNDENYPLWLVRFYLTDILDFINEVEED